MNEEEIQEAANNYVGHAEELGESLTTYQRRIAFADGAEWMRDNHRVLCNIREGDALIVDKTWLGRHEKNIRKEVIASACEWIMVTPMYNKQPTQLVDEFKQAMDKQV